MTAGVAHVDFGGTSLAGATFGGSRSNDGHKVEGTTGAMATVGVR